MAPSRPRISLQSRLEHDVDKLIRQLESSRGDERFKSTPDAYNAIQRSNSSLGRLKKRPLEDAIDRVLLFHKQEAEDSSDSEAALEKAEEAMTGQDNTGYLLNRQMTKLWHRHTPNNSKNTTNSAEQSPAKKRRLQQESEDVVTTTTKAQPNGNASTEAAPSTQQKQLPKKIQKLSRFTVEHMDGKNPLGGLGTLSTELLKLMRKTLNFSGYYENHGCNRRTGVILSGPQGMGKKSLVKNIAFELGVPLVSLNMCFFDPERMEKNMIEAFDAAMAQSRCIIFIDEVHRYMGRPDSSQHNDPHAKAVDLFTVLMQKLQRNTGGHSAVLAIATTSNIDEVNPNILQQGLFEKTLKAEMPDHDARKDVLKIVTANTTLGDDVDLDEIARMTHGFVPAEIAFVTNDAKISAVDTLIEEDHVYIRGSEIEASSLAMDEEVLGPLRYNMQPAAPVSMNNFEKAIQEFVPALRREGFSIIPTVTWDQVGALEEARKQLYKSIIGPIKRPALYEEFGASQNGGVLLWGPPGCGKTLVAQAVANDAKASFILINGPELLNKYVGESERAVRELFERARSSRPCILFFDEVDSLVPPRAKANTDASVRIVNTLLTELDGATSRRGVFVIGTTNRPELIDEAILRPGRLGHHIFIGLPTPVERVEILQKIYRTRRKNPVPEELDAIEKVALDPRCTNFSGADLSELQTKAAHSALERFENDETLPKQVVSADWEFALNNTRPSVKDADSYRNGHIV
ncbi:hypothetical protein E4U54_000169 [Claviceps lovelessii]|nr:hypothetical protein E4U54_000169 [Claviceps lovelessii]